MSTRGALVAALLGVCSSGGLSHATVTAAPSARVRATSLPEARAAVQRLRAMMPGSEASPRGGFLGAAPPLLANLPARSDGPLRLSIASDPGLWVELTPVGADLVEGANFSGHTVFSDAFTDTDVVLEATPDGVEDLRVLRSATAPAISRYRVAAGPSVGKLAVEDDRVVVRDRSGVVRMTTRPAFAVDARGERRAVRPRIDPSDPHGLAFEVATIGLAYPIAVDPAWIAVGGMKTPRRTFTMTKLANGSVLVTGGSYGGQLLSTAELYDPLRRAWRPAASMRSPRMDHLAVSLGDKVLVVGGQEASGFYLSSAELYDPASNTWTDAAPMSAPRNGIAWLGGGALVKDGEVLVSGGEGATGSMSSAEVYDAATNKWTTVGSLKTPRIYHCAIKLADGRILVTGGITTSSRITQAEVYDPKTRTFSDAAPMKVPRQWHVGALLAGGRVLVVAGSITPSAETYDPTTNTWTLTGGMLRQRGSPSMSPISGGRYLVPGGGSDDGEIFDPSTSTWTSAGTMSAQRGFQGSIALDDGSVLVAGGIRAWSEPPNPDLFLSTAELFSEGRQGQPCDASSACETGHCVDGVCCDTACADACRACNVAGSIGKCSPVATGAPGRDARPRPRPPPPPPRWVLGRALPMRSVQPAFARPPAPRTRSVSA